MNDLIEQILATINNHSNVLNNIEREEIIDEVVKNREAIVSQNGALATWSSPESTGRSPLDTVIVRRKSSEHTIDWSSPYNIEIDSETFEMLYEDAIALLEKKEKIHVTDRVIGADSKYALRVKTVTDRALTTLFIDNMFRPVPKDIDKSCFYNQPFYILALPHNKLDSRKYKSRLRMLPNGVISNMAVAIDFDRRVGLVIGSSYCGSVKKMLFTVMNYYLPNKGILPLHCSATEGTGGDSALYLGLSGTGKTTLSADPWRKLLGDDEHGWSDDGIANFEYGCYAKFIDINPKKEPEIYEAVMHKDDYLKHGAIIENAMVYPNGSFDFTDDRLTQNSRASYPLRYLKNIKEESTSTHPSTIFFLTADAYGVLPPISKLTPDQAMLWFLMGYTSKLAGTETGITKPQATFSRFFGAPFMPGKPGIYARMLGEKMEKYQTKVYLINTGWRGGSYGIGKRIDINYTRAMINATFTDHFDSVEYIEDKLFHLNIPKSVPEVPDEILNPIDCWYDKEQFHKTAEKLANQFLGHFDKAYGDKDIKESVRKQCPGK